MGSVMPRYRHVFQLRDGETLIVPDRDARRVIDKRSEQAEPETLWEVTLESGLVRRVWMDEIGSWDTEEVT